MAKGKTKDAVVAKETELVLNWFQACNHFQLSGVNRGVVEFKYKNDNFTIKDWTKVLQKDKLVK